MHWRESANKAQHWEAFRRLPAFVTAHLILEQHLLPREEAGDAKGCSVWCGSTPLPASACHCILFGNLGHQEIKRLWAGLAWKPGVLRPFKKKPSSHLFLMHRLYSGNSIQPLLMPFWAHHWLPRAEVCKKREEHLLRLPVSHCTLSQPSRVGLLVQGTKSKHQWYAMSFGGIIAGKMLDTNKRA